MHNTPIYISEGVGQVISLHQDLLERRLSFPSLYHELEAYALNLFDHFRRADERVIFEASNYHPDYIGASKERIMKSEMELEDFQLVIAREYGFTNWRAVKDCSTTSLNTTFEICVDDLLSGNAAKVKATLVEHPQLINMRSPYGHKAGLIHYLGSNGVELWRQVVPQNLVSLLKLLIDFNVDLSMQANIYGHNGLLALLTSSDHPWKAGVAQEAIAVLKEEA